MFEPDFEDLDDLFKEARAHIRKESEAKARTPRRIPGGVPKIEPSKLFSDPKNWYAARSVALIHQETQTLLGHFREMLHRTEKDCRRLVREDSPALIEAVEYVTGDWGYHAPQQPLHTGSSLTEHLCSMFVELEGLNVGAVCSLRIILQGVGILRVELVEDQDFGGGGTVLQLPSGTNLLPVMAIDSRKNLRKALDEH